MNTDAQQEIAELRDRAQRIRFAARRADRTEDMRCEMAEASRLEAAANRLETLAIKDEQRRKKLVAKVKIAQKQLHMEDGAYRDMLQSETGERSASKLKNWELENVLKRMRVLGFKDKAPRRAGTRPMAGDKQARLIRSLWIQLHEAGKVRDPSEAALHAWAQNQLRVSGGVEALQWLDGYQKQALIESLKQWLAR